MTRRTALLAAASCAAALASALLTLPAAFVWNVTASVPTGLYRVLDRGHLKVGDRVVIRPGRRLGDYLAQRGYLPSGVPLVKEVAALPGSRVCRTGRAITIDGQMAGFAKRTDSAGRPLPVWQGCLRLANDQLFVMSGSAAGFDGRYFGPLDRATLAGRAVPVWTRERGAKGHTWFAAAPAPSLPDQQPGD